jgi:hypothetical protein
MTSTEHERADAEPDDRRILKRGMLHCLAGGVHVSGWMTQPLLCYDRARIKDGRLHLKEWDCYLINDDEYALWLSVGNLGYIGLVSVQLFNLVHPSSKPFFATIPFPLHRMSLPQNSAAGSTRFVGRRIRVLCRAQDDQRRIMANFDEFIGGQTLAVDALLDRVPDESFATVEADSNDVRGFRYRRTVPALRASGSIKVGRRVHGFSPTRSFGLYSWNRAVLSGEWCRVDVCAQGWQDGAGGNASDGHVVALLFSGAVAADGAQDPDERVPQDNAISIDGAVTHVGPVRFEIPKSSDASTDNAVGAGLDVLGAWQVRDGAGIVDLTFVPDQAQADRHALGILLYDCQQVCGVFSGTVQVDGDAFQVQGLRGMASLERLRSWL